MQDTRDNPFDRLVAIMKRLRSESGCPWDRAQTSESLKPYLVEEAYELLEAIDSGSSRDTCDELGDLLLQVVFHAEIAAESASFDIDDVVESINRKMIRRHPHVFADFSGKDLDALNREWDRIKAEELRHKGEHPSPFDTIPGSLPALKFAAKLLSRTRRLELELPDRDAGPTATSCLERLQQTDRRHDSPDSEQVVGRLLFAIATLAVDRDIDPEEALRKHVTSIRNSLECGQQDAGGQSQNHPNPGACKP